MLSQLIYTRSSPHRDLKNNAQVVRGDGFGVFAVSEGLTHGANDNYEFLLARLAAPNCSRENSAVGLVHSYEYTSLGEGIYALSFEYARPHCRQPRKNGKTHRAGTYIKQCFIGDIGGYPFYWFGSSQWDAHLKSENDYYMDTDPNPVPPMLREISPQPQSGSVTEDAVRRFVLDGRGEALKAGVWFLLREYEKPEGERKVLLIKDEPQNVELWIAAIEYSFPQELARRITFTTNRSKLGTQPDKELFYYTDENGRFSALQNRSMNQQRHPYNMIVGYHPKDVYCSSLRKTPSSNFAVIDGAQKKAYVTVDETIAQPYYRAVEEFGKDLFDFCGAVMPGINMERISSEISDIYSAYRYLMSADNRSDKWSYEYALEALKLLTKYGVPSNAAVCSYLLGEGLDAYKRFAGVDSERGRPLIALLNRLAAASNRFDMIAEFFEGSIKDELERIDDLNSSLSEIWSAMKTDQLRETAIPLLDEVFSDEKLKGYSHKLKNAGEDVVISLSDMFFTLCAARYNSFSEILKSREQYSFLCYILMAALNWQSTPEKVLAVVGRSSRLFNAAVISVGQRLERKSPEKLSLWVRSSAKAAGRSAVDLSVSIAESGAADSVTAEKMLACAVRSEGRYTRESMNAAIKLIRRKDECSGSEYFCACADVCPPGELDRLIEFIMSAELSVEAQLEIFGHIDSLISFDPPEGFSKAGFHELKKWAQELDTISVSRAYYDLRRTLSSEQRENAAAKAMSDFLLLDEPLAKGFIDSRCFRELSAGCAAMCQSEIHILFLCLFVYEDERLRQRYTDAYVSCVLRYAHSGDVVKSLLNLCEPFVYTYKILGKTDDEVERASDCLEKSVRSRVNKIHLPQLEEKLSRYPEHDEDVKRTLLEIYRSPGALPLRSV